MRKWMIQVMIKLMIQLRLKVMKKWMIKYDEAQIDEKMDDPSELVFE